MFEYESQHFNTTTVCISLQYFVHRLIAWRDNMVNIEGSQPLIAMCEIVTMQRWRTYVPVTFL